MKLTELIFRLAEIEEEHGDLDIYTRDGSYYLVTKCESEEVDLNHEPDWDGWKPKPPNMQKVILLLNEEQY